MIEKYRREEKYIISVKDFYHLQGYLQCYLKRDENFGDRGYSVRSLYFDSYNDKDLFDVLNGQMEKRKIRIRTYSLDATMVKLEYKCKSGVDGIKKVVTISREEALSMTRGDYGFLITKGDPLAIKLYSRLKTGGYRPKILIEYNRKAYIYSSNNIRITFDSNLRASLITSAFFDDNVAWQHIMEPGLGILEVKYNGFLLGHLKKAIESIDSLSTASSKYARSRISCDF